MCFPCSQIEIEIMLAVAFAGRRHWTSLCDCFRPNEQASKYDCDCATGVLCKLHFMMYSYGTGLLQ